MARELTSVPQAVTGYGAVGVTWAHGTSLSSQALKFSVRTRTDGSWSDWTKLVYDDEHAPDPDSAEGRHARPGTDPLLVGRVDQVQVRANAHTFLPTDMQMAVIAPGKPKHTVQARAAIDTSLMDGNDGAHSAYDQSALTAAEEEAGEGQLGLAAATYTPQPVIYSRAQWGANENIRDKGSLHYFEVHAGFVHHTVNANNYTPDEVPGILRSIYAYHTQSRGWSDIGYNFLVDRFGRIWEGRYGGVDRPVVGAHTLNYNDYAFAMSAIGNFELVQPTAAMLQAYGVLFAWKLSLHGVDAASPQQWVGSKYFEAINGHRDAAATACPGKYLYAQIPLIRQYAAAAQQGWAGRELESSLVGSAYPDLIVRKRSDQQAYIIPTNGLTSFGAPTSLGTGWAGFDSVVLTPDITGDGKADLLARVAADGSTQVRPGDGNGGFGAAVNALGSFAGHDLITPVGDLNGDGRADLVARDPGTGRLDAYLGDGAGGFSVKQLGTTWGGYRPDRRTWRRQRRRPPRPGGARRRAAPCSWRPASTVSASARPCASAAAGVATTPSPGTATSTATARSTCWSGPPARATSTSGPGGPAASSAARSARSPASAASPGSRPARRPSAARRRTCSPAAATACCSIATPAPTRPGRPSPRACCYRGPTRC